MTVTQKEKWLQIEEMYGYEAKDEILRVLEKELLNESMIQVIRRGFAISGVHLDCAYFKPVSGLNPESQKQYDSNILSVIRQARFSEDNPKSLDLLLCLNGLPVVTAELKNPSKGQNYEDAIQMVKDDEADAMVADMIICILTVKQNPLSGLTTLRTPLNTEPIGIAISSGDTQFSNLVQNYLDTLEHVGVLDQLRKKWLEDDSWIESLP